MKWAPGEPPAVLPRGVWGGEPAGDDSGDAHGDAIAGAAEPGSAAMLFYYLLGTKRLR